MSDTKIDTIIWNNGRVNIVETVRYELKLFFFRVLNDIFLSFKYYYIRYWLRFRIWFEVKFYSQSLVITES